MREITMVLREAILFAVIFLTVSPADALSPIIQYQDLVCGSSRNGYADGAFYKAQFNSPEGLAISNDHHFLFIADTQNNCIRQVNLNGNNEVTTLAGSAAPGELDGSFEKALFNHPICPVVLPDGRIIVFDSETKLFRSLNPQTKAVTTLALAKNTALSSVWNMVYWPTRHSLCFSEPDSGTLMELNPETLILRPLAQGDPNLTSPKALCAAGDVLYVSDGKTGDIFELSTPTSTTSGSTTAPSSTLKKIGQSTQIIALASQGKDLYAYISDPNTAITRILPDSAPLTFVSTSGYRLKREPMRTMYYFFRKERDLRSGFIPDPDSKGRFLFTNQLGVCSFRDLDIDRFDLFNGEDSKNSENIHDFEYPEKKPPKTFRIMLIGRSYLYNTFDDKVFEVEDKTIIENQNYLRDLAKQLEFSLNEQASLNDWSNHFEVINAGMHRGVNCLEVWPYYVIPPLVKKYDVDLVLFLKDDAVMFPYAYFCCPLTKEGIPQLEADPEFVLQPNMKKFTSGPMYDLLHYLTKNPLYPSFDPQKADNASFTFNFGQWTSDPKVKEIFLSMVEKPLAGLQEKVTSYTTSSGKSCRIASYLFPAAVFGLQGERDFYKEAFEKAGFPFTDLSDELAVLNYSLGPIRSDPVNGGHFSRHGMTVFKDILENELIKNRMIPMASPTK